MNPIISDIASILENKINKSNSQTDLNVENMSADQVLKIQNFAKSFNELSNLSSWSLKCR